MAYDGELNFDTRIDKTGFKVGIGEIGNLAKSGLKVITDAVSAAIDVGKEYESAFAGVKKTVEATDAQLSALSDGILKMSERMPESAANIASVAEAAGQLGIATDDILGFTETMVNLGVATNLSAEEAASSLAKFANITGMSADDYDNLGSTIVALGNNFATTEADIVAMSTRLASAGSVVGLDEAQILAVSTALSSVGIEADAGGSAISKLLKDMETAAQGYGTASGVISKTGMSLRDLEMLADADSSAFKSIAQSLNLTSDELQTYMSNAKDLEDFANVSGMSAQQFVDAWGTDAVQALDMFVTGLSDTERLGKSSVEILGEMEINEVRLSNAILALSESGGILTETVNLANDAWDENTALTTEAQQRYETLDSKIEILKNSASNFGIAVYEEMQEPLRSLADLGMGYLSQLSTAFENEGFDGAAAALGDILGDIATKVAEVAPRIVELGISVTESLVEGILNNKNQLINAAKTIVTNLAKSLLTFAPQLLSAGSEIITALCAEFMNAKNIDKLIKAALQIVTTLVQTIVGNIGQVVSGISSVIQTIIGVISDNIPDIINAAKDIVFAIADGIIENLDDIIDAAFEIIAMLCEKLLDAENIKKLVKTAIEIVAKLAQAIIENLDDIVIAIAEGLVGAFSGFVSAFTDFKGEVDRMIEQEELLGESIQENIQQFNDLKDGANRVAAEDLVDVSKTEDLWEKLQSLVDASGRVKAADKERVEYIKQELTEATGIEIELVGNTIKEYDKLKTSIENVIAQRRAEIYMNANKEPYEAAVLGISEVEKELQAQYAAYEETKKKRDEIANLAAQYGIADVASAAELSGGFMESKGINYKEYIELGILAGEQRNNIKRNEELYKQYYESISGYETAMVDFANGRYEAVIDTLDGENEAFKEANELLEKSTEEQHDILVRQVKDAEDHYTFLLKQFENDVSGITQKTLDDAKSQISAAKDEYFKGGFGFLRSLADGMTEGIPLVNAAISSITDKFTAITNFQTSLSALTEDIWTKTNSLSTALGLQLEPLSLPSLPAFANGGFLKTGSAIVAEAGPEVITVTTGGVEVTPLSSSARNHPIASSSGLTDVVKATDSAFAAFDKLANTIKGITASVPPDTGNVINSGDTHSTVNYINEENSYNIYTQARNASEARELSEELAFLKKQNDIGKGKK